MASLPHILKGNPTQTLDILSGVLTASEFDRAGLGIHWEILQVHWAGGFDCESAK